jgi:membrane protein implicated in regulation of membrane protease activity
MGWLLAQPPLVWLLAGLVLMVLEVLLPGAYLIWLGIAAVGTGLVLELVALDFAWQVALFAALASGAIGAGLSMRGRRKPTEVNAPGSGLVGRTALALAFEGREGRVRLGDSDWPARLAEGQPPPAEHARLRVVGVDGMVLLVKPEMTEA